MKYLLYTFKDEYMTDNKNNYVIFSSLKEAYEELKTYFEETNYYNLVDNNTIYNFNQFISMSKIHDKDDLEYDFTNRYNYINDLEKEK